LWQNFATPLRTTFLQTAIKKFGDLKKARGLWILLMWKDGLKPQFYILLSTSPETHENESQEKHSQQTSNLLT
jgi:hypothetical protein